MAPQFTDRLKLNGNNVNPFEPAGTYVSHQLLKNPALFILHLNWVIFVPGRPLIQALLDCQQRDSLVYIISRQIPLLW